MSAEEVFVSAFVDGAKRDRWRAGLSDSRLRAKLLQRLWNSGSDWTPDHVTPLKLTGKRHDQIESLIEELRRRGAGASVHVLATDADFDGRTLTLDQAVNEFIDDGGAVLVCGPTLALHLPESGDPLLLTR